MSEEILPLKPEELLSQGAFLTRLARDLVGDDHHAEDLVQEAWKAAVERYSSRKSLPSDFSAWMVGIVRNAALKLQRGEGNRRARERHVARPEGGGSESEVSEILHMQGLVARALEALDEPYKTVLFRRYHWEQSPRQIGTDLGIPTSTVNTQIARGRQKLRDELDRQTGGESMPMLLALLPFPALKSVASETARRVTAKTAAGTVPTMGVGILSIKLGTTIAVLIACSILAFMRFQEAGSDPKASEGIQVDAGPEANLVSPKTTQMLAHAATTQRNLVEETNHGESVVDRPVVASVKGVTVQGRVISQDSRPVIGVDISLTPVGDDAKQRSMKRTRSDSLGRFEIDGVLGTGILRVTSPGWVTLLYAIADPLSVEQESVIVAGNGGHLVVEVVDVEGQGVPDAKLEYHLPSDFNNRFAQVLDHSSSDTRKWKCDSSGVFDLRSAPNTVGARLHVTANGFKATKRTLGTELKPWPAGESNPLRIQLQRIAADPQALTGRVVDPNGFGLANAWVACGSVTTQCDEEGAFALDSARLQKTGKVNSSGQKVVRLRAAAPGFMPMALEIDAGAGRWEYLLKEGVELQLLEPSRSIAGRVLDDKGRALEGISVQLARTEIFGDSDRTIEAIAANLPRSTQKVMTDAMGRFELKGLGEGPYEIAAVNEETLQIATAKDVEGGNQGVAITMDSSALWQQVRGKVVDRDGRAIEGASVILVVGVQQAYGPRGGWSTGASRPKVGTDVEGKFTFSKVPMGPVRMYVSHPDIVETKGPSFKAEDHDRTGTQGLDIEIEVQRCFRLHVLFDGARESDWFEIVDGEGERLSLSERHGQTTSSGMLKGRFSEGRSSHFFIEERPGLELVLYRDNVELRREVLQLMPYVTNTVDL